MKLSVKATAGALALVWGVLVMFLTAAANIVWPGYAQGFLQMMASLYPGYTAAPGFGQAVVGMLYGLVDGAVVGAIFAWLYNLFATENPRA